MLHQSKAGSVTYRSKSREKERDKMKRFALDKVHKVKVVRL
jgi:tetratricopeptide (TPR) repeat protein